MGNLTDAEFLAFFNALLATVSGNLAAYVGITAGMVTQAGTLRDATADTQLDYNQKREAAKAARIAKDEARAEAEAFIRQMRDLMKANGVSDADFAALGFPSSGPSGESASSATVPVATVDTSKRLQHTINWADASAPNIKRRPKGVRGLQIWNKIDGPLPGSEIDCSFLTTDSATPYTVTYPPEHAGKIVHYMYRWQFNDDTYSAWGETVSATITG